MKLKFLEGFAEAVTNREKTFEVRENDRGYQKGDLIHFKVISKYGHEIHGHSLSEMVFEITYVLSGYGIKDGWVVFGIKEVRTDK